MGRIDVAGAAGRLLATPNEGDLRLRRGASRLIADVLDALDDEQLGGVAKAAIAQRIGQMKFAPLLGQLLTAAMKEGRHQPVMDSFIRWLAQVLEENQALIYQMVHERANTVVRWTTAWTRRWPTPSSTASTRCCRKPPKTQATGCGSRSRKG